jgi:hypothetical protein
MFAMELKVDPVFDIGGTAVPVRNIRSFFYVAPSATVFQPDFLLPLMWFAN